MAKKFEDLNYAQEYLLNIVQSKGLSIDDALREAIRAMSLQTFAKKSRLSVQSVSDFVTKKKEWSADKIEKKIMKVFRLEIRRVSK